MQEENEYSSSTNDHQVNERQQFASLVEQAQHLANQEQEEEDKNQAYSGASGDQQRYGKEEDDEDEDDNYDDDQYDGDNYEEDEQEENGNEVRPNLLYDVSQQNHQDRYGDGGSKDPTTNTGQQQQQQQMIKESKLEDLDEDDDDDDYEEDSDAFGIV